jgi:2-amino-4-hydroxy-6-hydroxymethyldihydropteridine diphosphokinase
VEISYSLLSQNKCKIAQIEMRTQHQLFLGLGSNLGDRQANLRGAVEALANFMAVEAISPLYQTAPWGMEAQPDFLNLCLVAATSLEPISLLTAVKKIETQLGRQPAARWGPRLIDIDILFYGDLVLSREGLTIPHPQLHQRAFVLAPLADLTPDLRHPQTDLTIAQMLTAVDQTGIHKLAEPLFTEFLLSGVPQCTRQNS